MSKKKYKQNRQFTLLVKPASADCNLHCDYCFYLDKQSLYPEEKQHRMSTQVLEKMIGSYMATRQPVYSFGWQGGEPTILGTEFFRTVTNLQQHYGKSGMSVANGLQTNGTLIDDEMAAHFAGYKFLLGVSLDGPPELHNVYRKSKNGEPTHDRVLQGIQTLDKHGVEYNILTLVSTANVEEPKKVFRYLADNGFLYHQYIPCVEFDGEGNPLPWNITGEQWGRFLCGIFDEWIGGYTEKVSVRYFDSLMQYLFHNRQVICTQGTNCRQYFVVEYNGDVYPCDFFVKKNKKLGNIMQDSWSYLGSSQRYRNFGRMKSRWNEACVTCPFLKFCAGDCLKHRLYAGNEPETLSWLCRGQKMFFEHALPELKRLTESVRQSVEQEMMRR